MFIGCLKTAFWERKSSLKNEQNGKYLSRFLLFSSKTPILYNISIASPNEKKRYRSSTAAL